MNYRPTRPVILITGSNQRTGASLAVELAKDAATVVIQSRHGEGADELVAAVKAAGANSYFVRGDVTNPDDVQKMVAEIEERSGRIDVLINNVGHFLQKSIREVDFNEWNDMINSNLTSCFLMCKEVLPGMEKRQFGRIINIADSAADRIQAAVKTTPYIIAKTGVLILTKSLALSYASSDITINAISPGVLENSIVKPPFEEIPKLRYGEISDILGAIRYFIEASSKYVTGANLLVAGARDL
jgi:3-oxoacyl-[acyl-carrier protein] reductase